MASIGDSDKTKKKTNSTNLPPASASAGKVAIPKTQPNKSASEVNLKRKAEDQATSQHNKIAKQPVPSAASALSSRGSTASPAPRTKSLSVPTSVRPHKDTNRPSPATPVATKASATGIGSVGSQARPQTAPASSAPKKGYLAILEKAKAAQETAKPFGQIKHQKKEKERLSSKARARLAEEAAAAKKMEKRPVSSPSKPSDRSAGKAAPAGPPVDGKKQSVEVGYKGTMRSASSTYQGTMDRSGSKPGANRPAKPPAPGAAGRYRYAEESEEEDEDEDMDDYDSASSDMEAGLDDIDREEMLSARQARQEDEEALREENEHKRQKFERQRKLQALNAAAAKKKKVY